MPQPLRQLKIIIKISNPNRLLVFFEYYKILNTKVEYKKEHFSHQFGNIMVDCENMRQKVEDHTIAKKDYGCKCKKLKSRFCQLVVTMKNKPSVDCKIQGRADNSCGYICKGKA